MSAGCQAIAGADCQPAGITVFRTTSLRGAPTDKAGKEAEEADAEALKVSNDSPKVSGKDNSEVEEALKARTDIENQRNLAGKALGKAFKFKADAEEARCEAAKAKTLASSLQPNKLN